MFINKGLQVHMFIKKYFILLKKIFNTCTFVVCFVAITGFSNKPSRPILDIYNQAMAVKSSDPQLSQELLFRLKYRREELTEEQRVELVYLTGYLQTARGNYYRAIQIHKNLTLIGKPDIALRAYANMLQIKVLMRDYGGAAQLVPEIVKIINDQSLKLPSNIVHNTLIALTAFYNQLNQYQQASIYTDILYKSSLTPRQHCFANVQRTQTQLHLEKIELTDKSILDTQKLCLNINEESLLQNYLADLAHIYIDRDRYQDAINLLNKEIKRSDTIHWTLNKAEYNAYLAHSYMHLGNAKLAKKHAFETLKHVKNLSEPLPKAWAYNVLYQDALQQNKTLDAIKYLQLFSKANDEYTQIIHLKSLGVEQAQQGLSAIESDVALYDNKLKLNDAMQVVEQMGNESFKRYRLIQITLEILFLLLVSYQLYSIYRVKRNVKTASQNLVYDPTTAVYHRNDFIKQVDKILKPLKNTNKLCGLLILNLDDLARINLIHNSDRGDWVIKYGIQACKEVCSKNEIIGRLGGDEFAILMTEKSLAEMKVFANEILLTFQQLDTSKVTYRFDSYCSIGFSDTNISGHNIQQLIKDADTALRKAKAQGKNRVNYVNETQCPPSY